MFTSLLETQILEAIENARRDTEHRLSDAAASSPEGELRKCITSNFSQLNFSYQNRGRDSAHVFVQDVHLEKSYESAQPAKGHSPGKSIVGGALVLAGQPLLRKRFVMAGSSAGTSIASKYLSTVFPQKMPARILGTRVLGRAIGRAIPYIGWALIAIDVIELLIEESHTASPAGGYFNGFGGSFGGGGSGGSW